MGITSIAEIIYLVGGIDEKNNVDTSARFLTQIEEWQQVQNPVSENWSNLGLVSLGMNIYAVGGRLDQVTTKNQWSYQAIFLTVLPIIE